jgi:phospholipid/cholesterol/gamma-HCH transport system substrate-binding protein
MNNRKLELWVGLFVSLAIASLLMMAIQVSGLSNFYRHESGYTILAPFDNIGGLKAKSKVTIAGVTIGRVTKISLTVDQYGEYHAMVEIFINSDFNKIPSDSSAKILTAGLLGDNYIGITPGNASDYLKEGDKVQFTTQALLLEDLISKFAVGGKKE